jgi:uncharacterized protein (DUF885 family)
MRCYSLGIHRMTLDRRRLLLTAAAAGLMTQVRAAQARPAAPASPQEAALGRYLDDLAERLLRKYPETATSLGLDQGARAPLKAHLNDRSWAAVEGDRALCEEALKGLAAFPDAGLSVGARLNRDVTAYALGLGREAAAFDFGDNTLNSAMNEAATPYVVNQQTGDYSGTPEFLDSQHQVRDAADAEAYLSRLHDMAKALDQETDRIRKDAGAGVIPPDFILANTVGQQKDLLAIAPAQARFVTALARKTHAARLAGDWAGRAQTIAEREIYPALARQHDALASLTPRAGHDAGVWRLPTGDLYYRWALHEATSTDLTPEQVHQMGLEQNQAIDARMDAILKANGLAQGTVGERMAALGKDPRFVFPDTDAGRQQILDYLNGLVAGVRPQLPKAFNLRLKAPVEIKRVPIDIQNGAPQGYMNPGSIDGSRPSIYYINLKTTENWPKFSLPTLTYHETIPGHAWQGAYLTETGKLPLIRLILSGFNAYVEGWALYAEQLADEIGMYDADWAGRLGYLQAQKFRAVRLVIDTGLHAKRWTREQAVQWAIDNTGRTRDAMTSEVDRYCSWPGQACGYKVGHTEINRLRDKAKAQLGARYDLRAYDDLVVETGAVPLTVLANVVDSWIASGGRLTL